jgi:hypothetical protein
MEQFHYPVSRKHDQEMFPILGLPTPTYAHHPVCFIPQDALQRDQTTVPVNPRADFNLGCQAFLPTGRVNNAGQNPPPVL